MGGAGRLRLLLNLVDGGRLDAVARIVLNDALQCTSAGWPRGERLRDR